MRRQPKKGPALYLRRPTTPLIIRMSKGSSTFYWQTVILSHANWASFSSWWTPDELVVLSMIYSIFFHIFFSLFHPVVGFSFILFIAPSCYVSFVRNGQNKKTLVWPFSQRLPRVVRLDSVSQKNEKKQFEDKKNKKSLARSRLIRTVKKPEEIGYIG